jgi:hypothetical protein
MHGRPPMCCVSARATQTRSTRISAARSCGTRFPSVVDAVVVEFGNGAHQALLDRFILEGATMSRDELAVVWRDTHAEVWESPVYEEFLRAMRDVNQKLPRRDRVRVIAGDTAIDGTVSPVPNSSCRS